MHLQIAPGWSFTAYFALLLYNITPGKKYNFSKKSEYPIINITQLLDWYKNVQMQISVSVLAIS